MRTVSNLLEAAKKVNLDEVAENALYASKDVLIKQQQLQMYAGFDNNGDDITPLHGRYKGYAESTKDKKRREGKIWQWVTLKDKSDFYNGIGPDIRGSEFFMTSEDPKTISLVAYYGPTIFGLNEQSISDIVPEETKAFIDTLEIELNKK